MTKTKGKQKRVYKNLAAKQRKPKEQHRKNDNFYVLHPDNPRCWEAYRAFAGAFGF